MKVAILPLEQQSLERRSREPGKLACNPAEPRIPGNWIEKIFDVTLNCHLQIIFSDAAIPRDPETRLTSSSGLLHIQDVGLVHLIGQPRDWYSPSFAPNYLGHPGWVTPLPSHPPSSYTVLWCQDFQRALLLNAQLLTSPSPWMGVW